MCSKCKQSGGTLLILALLVLMGGWSAALGARTLEQVTPTMTFTKSTSTAQVDDDGNWTFTVEPGQYKFGEPMVAIFDGGNNITTSFDITYGIDGVTTLQVDQVGRAYYTHEATGTTVLKNSGDVEIGSKVGALTVVVTATPKSLFASQYTAVSKSYVIDIPKYQPDVAFSPEHVKIRVKHEKVESTWPPGTYNVYNTSSTVPYPSYTISTKGITVQDVKDYYDVAVTIPEGQNQVKGVEVNGEKRLAYGAYSTNPSWSGSGNVYVMGDSVYQGKTAEEADLLKPLTTDNNVTLTYTFTPKAGYEDTYATFTKEVTVSILENTGNLTVTTSLDDCFNDYNAYLNTLPNRKELCGLADGETNVPSTARTIHVYKYPYTYELPKLKTFDSDGNDLTSKVAYFFYIKKDGNGQVGDTEVDPATDGYGTYEETEFDYTPYHQEAGRKTNLNVYVQSAIGNQDGVHFQVSHPGLNRIGVFAYVSDTSTVSGYPTEDVYGGDYRSDYYQTVHRLGNELEFDIDTKKRVAYLDVTPDPGTRPIGVGDEVTFDNNFVVSGYMTDELHTEPATLTYSEDYSTGFLYTIDYPAFMDSAYFESYKEEAAKFGLDDKYVFAIRNYPTESSYEPTPFQKEFTYEYKDAAGQVTMKTETVTWMRRYTAKGHQNVKAWSIAFNKAGSWPMVYEVKPWNGAKWDGGPNNAKTYNFTVQELKPTEIEIVPVRNGAATTTGDSFAEPRVRVVDNFGNDVTQFYNLAYAVGTDDATQATGTLKTNSGNKFDKEITVGPNEGDATINVSATRKTDDELRADNSSLSDEEFQKLLEVRGKYQLPADKPYYIYIRGVNDDPSKLYEIVRPQVDGGPAESTDDKAGKLHMIGQGQLLSGFSVNGVPGLDIQFGEFSDKDVWEFKKSSYAAVSSDNDNDKEGDDKVNYIVTNPSHVVLGDDGIPTSGAFVKFMPFTNGFLHLDGLIIPTETYHIVGQDNKTGQVTDHSFKTGSWGVTADMTGELATLGFAMLDGYTYYMYCDNPDNFVLHGVWYEPAFVLSESDAAATKEATVFFNGYAPNLPKLLVTPHASVSFTSGSADATVDGRYGTVQPKKQNLNPGVTITGKVYSTEYGDIWKTPSYVLKIADFPIYKLSASPVGPAKGDYEKDSYHYVAVPGDTVSTYNFRTGITMTYGGWSTESFSYGKNKTDSYKPNDQVEGQVGGKSKFDMSYSRFIDGFSWSTSGTQNPVDENAKSYGSYNWYDSTNTEVPFRNTFSVPRYGTYMKFEPTEPGVLFVYLLQNGSCSDTGNRSVAVDNSKVQLKWCPIWIVDESGRPAPPVDAASMGSISEYLANTGDSRSKGSYTLSLARATAKDADVDKFFENNKQWTDKKKTYDYELADGGAECSYDWSKFKQDLKNPKSFETTQKAIIDSWKRTPADHQQEVIQVTSGGYTMISKAYMRYGIDVKAGKTYFIFQNGSKFGLCGFAFLPQGWKPERAFDPATDGDEGNVQLALDDDHTLAQSVEDAGGDAQVYGKRATVTLTRGTTAVPGFRKGVWTSICLPFSVSETLFKQVFGDKASIVTYANTTKNGTTANFTQHGYLMMEAGRPYFVKFGKDDTSSLVFKNVTLEKEYTNPSQILTDKGYTTFNINPDEGRLKISENGFTFKGTYNGETMPAYSYYFNSKGQLRYSTKPVALKHYRAYMMNPDSDAGKAKLGSMATADVMSDEGTVTSIEDVVVAPASEAVAAQREGVFNLAGQKVAVRAADVRSLPKGVYVVNGKKTVVK